MKTCTNCHAQLPDDAAFCTQCGCQFGDAQPTQGNVQNPQQQYAPAPAYDPYDHTSEFDAKDISDNKVFALACYLLDFVGVIIALLASKSSNYTMFHIRQSLKISVVEILVLICTAALCWTIIVPIAAAAAFIFLLVVRVICFFQICGGKAKEPVLIRKLGFLK